MSQILQNGYVYWDGLKYTIVSTTLIESASGDLSGNYPGPTVVGLQNIPISSTRPTNGQVLGFDGTRWTPSSAFSAGTAAGGDLSGTYPNPVVAKLQGRTVSSAAPTLNYVLTWTGSQWAPAAASAGAVTLAGDVTGTNASDTVVQISGSAGSTSVLSSLLPTDITYNLGNITHRFTGLYSQTGMLGGTSLSGSGTTMTVQAENSLTGSYNGGNLTLKGGARGGEGAIDGSVNIFSASNQIASFADSGLTSYVPILPDTDLVRSIGSYSLRWGTIYSQLGINGGTSFTGSGSTMTIQAEDALYPGLYNGAALDLYSGTGATGSSSAGGTGGDINVTAQPGGAGSGSNQAGGAGGNINITSGAGGSSAGAALGGTAGSVLITLGEHGSGNSFTSSSFSAFSIFSNDIGGRHSPGVTGNMLQLSGSGTYDFIYLGAHDGGLYMTPSSITWDANITSPTITQGQSTTGAGVDLIIKSQAAETGSSASGGNIDLRLGASDGAGNIYGTVNVQLDGYAGNMLKLGLNAAGGQAVLLVDNFAGAAHALGFGIHYLNPASNSQNGANTTIEAQKADQANNTNGGDVILAPGNHGTGSGSDGYVAITNAHTSFSATTGGSGDVPGQVVGYLQIKINGAIYSIPYYNT